MRKPQPFNQIIHILQHLHREYPAQNLGRHFSMALEDYGNLWGLSDKEMAYALDKYLTALSIDPLASEAEIEKLYQDTTRLFTEGIDYLESDEEEEY